MQQIAGPHAYCRGANKDSSRQSSSWLCQCVHRLGHEAVVAFNDSMEPASKEQRSSGWEGSFGGRPTYNREHKFFKNSGTWSHPESGAKVTIHQYTAAAQPAPEGVRSCRVVGLEQVQQATGRGAGRKRKCVRLLRLQLAGGEGHPWKPGSSQLEVVGVHTVLAGASYQLYKGAPGSTQVFLRGAPELSETQRAECRAALAAAASSSGSEGPTVRDGYSPDKSVRLLHFLELRGLPATNQQQQPQAHLDMAIDPGLAAMGQLELQSAGLAGNELAAGGLMLAGAAQVPCPPPLVGFLEPYQVFGGVAQDSAAEREQQEDLVRLWTEPEVQEPFETPMSIDGWDLQQPAETSELLPASPSFASLQAPDFEGAAPAVAGMAIQLPRPLPSPASPAHPPLPLEGTAVQPAGAGPAQGMAAEPTASGEPAMAAAAAAAAPPPAEQERRLLSELATMLQVTQLPDGNTLLEVLGPLKVHGWVESEGDRGTSSRAAKLGIMHLDRGDALPLLRQLQLCSFLYRSHLQPQQQQQQQQQGASLQGALEAELGRLSLSGSLEVGLIAEEVQKVVPGLVVEGASSQPGQPPLLAVTRSSLQALMLGGLQEVADQVDQTQVQVQHLQQSIAGLGVLKKLSALLRLGQRAATAEADSQAYTAGAAPAVEPEEVKVWEGLSATELVEVALQSLPTSNNQATAAAGKRNNEGPHGHRKLLLKELKAQGPRAFAAALRRAQEGPPLKMAAGSCDRTLLGCLMAALKQQKHSLDLSQVPREVLVPRPYQKAVLGELQPGRNYLGAHTGVGKTPIAILHASEVLKRTPRAKGVLLAPTTALTSQEAVKFQGATQISEQHSVAVANGGTVDVERWPGLIARHSVLCMTPDTLLNLFQAKVASFSQMGAGLLIIDECHNVKGNSSTSKLLNAYRALPAGSPRPSILGMTASPVGSSDQASTEEAIQQLAASMDAAGRIIHLDRYHPDVREHVTEPEMREELVEPAAADVDCAKRVGGFVADSCRLLHELLLVQHAAAIDAGGGAAEASHPSEKEVRLLGPLLRVYEDRLREGRWMGQVANWLNAAESFAVEECALPNAALVHLSLCLELLRCCLGAVSLASDLGFQVAVREIAQGLRTVSQELPEAPARCGEEDGAPWRLLLLGMFASISSTVVHSEELDSSQRLGVVSSPKLQALVRLLGSLGSLGEGLKGKGNCHVIVFARARATAAALSRLLGGHPQLRSLDLQVHVLMGQGGKAAGSRKHGMSRSAQEAALQCFKQPGFRVLVATAAAEEGIDVPSCEVVIWYSVTETGKELIQSQGRARVRGGQYISIMDSCSTDPQMLGKAQGEVSSMQSALEVLAVRRKVTLVPRP